MIILTKAQRLELRRLEEEAMAEMTKASPNYKSGLAGTALSAGGFEMMWALLDTLFEGLQQAARELPEEFSRSISADTLAAVDAAATAYLATDLYRPPGRWSLFSAKNRALRRERNDKLDLRAWLAAAHLKRARVFLRPRG